MKRFISLALPAALIMAAGACHAADAVKVDAAKYREVMVDRNKDGTTDGVDIYSGDDKVVRRGYDDNGDMVVDRWQATDENTGMPIVVPSDASFELR